MIVRGRILRAGALLLAALVTCGISASDLAYDQATDRLAERIEALPRNRALRTAVEARVATLGRNGPTRLARALAEQRIVPLRVPGLLYATHPQSGADLAAVSDWLGMPVAMIPTDEVGTSEDNAAIIARVVEEQARDGSRIALISASKGSADVAIALAAHPEIRPRIAIWIDLVGILDGTPLLDAGSPTRAESAAWLPDATAESMSEAARGREALGPEEVRGILVVHVAAFPHVEDVSAEAREAFQQLRTRGPNDGYIMLDQYLHVPGRVLVVRGTDHYLRTRVLPVRVAAALFVALREPGPTEAGAVPEVP
jgi:hypothetical protein